MALHPHAQAALARWYADDQPATGTLYVFRSRKGANRPLTRQTCLADPHGRLCLLWHERAPGHAQSAQNLCDGGARATRARSHRTQQALGHANISSTIHYLPVAEVEIQQAIVSVSYQLGAARP